MGHSGRMRSVEASRAVWQTNEKLTGSELLVLQALAHHAGEHFECYPSLGRLATMTKLSKRQVIRLLRGLREKGHVAFEENRGGRQKCNHYRLLIAEKGDIKGDANGDIANGDTPKNGDIPNSERVTSCAETMTNSHGNGDTAMSPEGFEWLEGVKSESGQKLPTPVFRGYNEVLGELESNPGKLMGAILGEGIPITRNEVCDARGGVDEQRHGPFVRHGWLWGNWLALEGIGDTYSSAHEGCPACDTDHARWEKEKVARHPELRGSWHERSFELYSPAMCGTHGPFMFKGTLWQYPAGRSEEIRGSRYQVSPEICPDCESEMVDEMNIQEHLSLSNEEMERGRDAIVAARDYACGYIDSSLFLSVLQDRIIPDLEGKRAAEGEIESGH
jgi:Helix-turn-helix domain